MITGVLDLLSVVGKLSLSGDAGFGEAARLASGCTTDDFTDRAVRRDLQGLGHIRCVYGKSREVHVLAPRICLLPERDSNSCKALLVGARTREFIEKVQFVCTASCKVQVEKTVLGGGLPDRILLRGSYGALEQVAYKLQVDIGDDPTIPDAWRLLLDLPPW